VRRRLPEGLYLDSTPEDLARIDRERAETLQYVSRQEGGDLAAMILEFMI